MNFRAFDTIVMQNSLKIIATRISIDKNRKAVIFIFINKRLEYITKHIL